MEPTLALLLLGILGSTCAQDFYVVAPSMLRLNSNETVAIAIDGTEGALVNVYIMDHPGKRKNITERIFQVVPGSPNVLTFRLEAEDFPPDFLTDPGSSKRVSLNVCFQNVHKEMLIPISSQSGYMFIQTDKPIYTPNQPARFRIIYLTEEALPSSESFQLQIKNPANIIVEEKSFSNKRNKGHAFVNHNYQIPTLPVLGEWSATVRYGHNLEHNSTIQFEIREYVLPTFTLELKTPDMILPDTDVIQVEVNAQHVYGKKTKGVVSFRLGIKTEHGTTTHFAIFSHKKLVEGHYKLEASTEHMKNHSKIGWFPGIDKSRLEVEATVVEDVTGEKVTAVDSKAIFSNSPYVISFKRCLSDFRPGYPSVVEADVSYVDGRPAEDIECKITAVADNGEHLLTADITWSDQSGRVAFTIQPEIQHKTIKLTVETNDPRYEKNQAQNSFEQHAYISPNNAYLYIARTKQIRLKPEEIYAPNIHFEPHGLRNIYYLVVARGKILEMDKLKSAALKQHMMTIKVKHEMAPDFRIVVFAHNGDELLVDSLKINVDRVCNPNAVVTIKPDIENVPGGTGKIIIQGTYQTSVALLGVDEAVYALSKKDLLTNTKMFDRLSSHDLGCGPGGGINVNAVLGNAGISITTNKFSSSHSHSCVEIKRKKRELAEEITRNFNGKDKQCCALGLHHDRYDRSCEQRKPIISKLDELYSNCSEVFMECCLHGKDEALTDLKLRRQGGMNLARMTNDNFDDADIQLMYINEADEDEERSVSPRSDFRETFIYETLKIGPDKREERPLSLPHSITTWVISAVSVSPRYGMCVSEPQKILSFKNVFLHLNLPYSVVRNEQVEVRATVFNYSGRKIYAMVYMYGAKGLCSGTQPGERSERKKLEVEPQSAASVAFPVVPLTTGNVRIKVVALSLHGSDIVEKQLYVVPEGVTKQIDIPIPLDPTNQQKRKKRDIETKLYSDNIDTTQNLQVTIVKLPVPEGFVPGTAICSISAFGHMFSQVVETVLHNPDRLLQMPQGCGEQNMIILAPTLYTMKYLKVTGRLTPENEAKGYEFIRKGYDNQLSFRKEDGSYSIYPYKPASTWLTAFVMKVFCQASTLVHIDENVINSGVEWLIRNQVEGDGSYVEKYRVQSAFLKGGVQGTTTLTAFVLIALRECKYSKNEESLQRAKVRAIDYLENHILEVNEPLPMAIVAYALALSESAQKQVAYDKLLSMAKYNEDYNWMYWTTENSAQDIEATSYGLLTQLLFNDMTKSNSIVNWLNTKQQQSGSFKSTQDTVIALQSLSEYAQTQVPSVNLVSNISLSNDRSLHEVLTFNENNAHVLQELKIDTIGGDVFINTAGYGTASMSVKLRYNVLRTTEDPCKFEINVNVTDPKSEVEDNFPKKVYEDTRKELENEPPASSNVDLRRRSDPRASLARLAEKRVRRQNLDDNRNLKLISLCVRYLGNSDAEMSIVEVGLFSGFEPVQEDLRKLVKDSHHFISRFETSSRGLVFYLDKIPIAASYCFSFHVIRKYIVGKTQTSVIKVYDYYNPDETCTKFYSPESNSPLIRTICDGDICDCAEGGCPPENAFTQMVGPESRDTPIEQLMKNFCENYDYVWKGNLSAELRQDGGFLNISFTIEEVIKPGIEKKYNKIMKPGGKPEKVYHIVGKTRTLLARETCQTAKMSPGYTYLILGRDGQEYRNEDGDSWYRYLLDQTSIVYLWTKRSQSLDPTLQARLDQVTRQLKRTGCDSVD